MKKVCAILLAILLILGTTACNHAVTLPLPEKSIEMVFSSGVGAWESILTLHRDGSFEGKYYDVDMGITGEDYPNGTMYLCNFSGKFTNIEKVNKYIYTMQLDEVTAVETKGDEWIEDGLRYIGAMPYGIEGGKEFRFYLPDVLASEVTPKTALFFSPAPIEDYDDPNSTLAYHALVNVDEEAAFFDKDY